MERQEYMLSLVMDICRTDFSFNGFLEIMDYFKRIINACRQMNYSLFKSEEFDKYAEELKAVLAERKVK